MTHVPSLHEERPTVMPQWMSVVTGGTLLVASRRHRNLFGSALAAAGGIFLYRGFTRAAANSHDRRPRFGRGLRAKESITIASSPQVCYRRWRDLGNLPKFIDHLESVRAVSSRRSHWVAKGKGGASLKWDAEITRDVPGRMIGWRSLPGSVLDTAGSVRFIEKGDGSTKVDVKLKYNPPTGLFGAALLDLFAGQPARDIQRGLHRFKAWIEDDAKRDAAIDLASEGSFPASDPPPWTAAVV